MGTSIGIKSLEPPSVQATRMMISKHGSSTDKMTAIMALVRVFLNNLWN